MEVEIPFIPASQRPANAMNEEQDTIVVVGQARQKRKRPKAGVIADGVEAVSGSAGAKVKKTKVKDETEVQDEDRETFDFSAIPNILDDNPNVGDGNKKKRDKKEKKGASLSFNFLQFNSDLNIQHAPSLRWRILWRFPCTSKSP